MRTIEIDDAVHDFLLRNTSRFGETPSDVLRRLLKLPSEGGGQSRAATAGGQMTPDRTVKGPVTGFLNSPAFLVHGSAVGRFLSVLSWLYSQHSDAFEKVLLLNGRKRRYFARTAEELEASGSSVMPKRIPDSPYWVITNSPTQLKKETIADVLRVLGYDPTSARMLVEALR